MERIYLTKKEFKRLKHFYIEEEVANTEANFYYDKNNDEYLFKIYRFKDDKYLQGKEKTIKDIIESKDLINIPELILPLKEVFVDNNFRGSIIKRVKGCNTSLYLNDSFIPLKTKIDILKQIGTILDKIKNANPSLNLAFGDVHTDNFMISDDKVFGIDTDGMNIFDNKGRINYYLDDKSFIRSIKKYPIDDFGLIKASTNTDIFCFIMMIFDVLTNDKIYRLSLNEYKYYLDYLDKLGFDNKLLTSFASIYDENIPNISPLPYFDELNRTNDSTILQLKRKNGR